MTLYERQLWRDSFDSAYIIFSKYSVKLSTN